MIDTTKITDVVVDGIDYNDYPDFCDAYIASCLIDGVEATDEQLEEINEDGDFVYNAVLSRIF
jgi:hypothetical protein